MGKKQSLPHPVPPIWWCDTEEQGNTVDSRAVTSPAVDVLINRVPLWAPLCLVCALGTVKICAKQRRNYYQLQSDIIAFCEERRWVINLTKQNVCVVV